MRVLDTRIHESFLQANWRRASPQGPVAMKPLSSLAS
jgi:hypothetical protein